MKKALVYFTLGKQNKTTPQLVFIYDDGDMKILANELMSGWAGKARQMRNRLMAMSPSEREADIRMMFEEYTPATPGYRDQHIAVDYEGEDKEFADKMFDELSARNFDNEKRSGNG